MKERFYKLGHSPVRDEDFSLIKKLLEIKKQNPKLTNKDLTRMCGRSTTTITLVDRYETYEQYRAYITSQSAKKNKRHYETVGNVYDSPELNTIPSENKEALDPNPETTEDEEDTPVVIVKGLDELTAAVRDLVRAWDNNPKKKRFF